MKIKQEIEWVFGENPESTATKLIAIRDDGGILIQTGSFYADEEMSAPCWHFENGETVPMQHAEVLAWASMPTFEGFPAEGQKVEFDDVHKCNQMRPNHAVESLINAIDVISEELVSILTKEMDSKLASCREPIRRKIARINKAVIDAKRQ